MRWLTKQNRFINECGRKIKAKIPEFQSFFVRYRRTYVLNNTLKTYFYYTYFMIPDVKTLFLYIKGIM